MEISSALCGFQGLQNRVCVLILHPGDFLSHQQQQTLQEAQKTLFCSQERKSTACPSLNICWVSMIKASHCKYTTSFDTYCYRQWQNATKYWSNTGQTNYTKPSRFHTGFCWLLQRGKGSKILKKLQGSHTRMLSRSQGFSGAQISCLECWR